MKDNESKTDRTQTSGGEMLGQKATIYCIFVCFYFLPIFLDTVFATTLCRSVGGGAAILTVSQ